MIDPCFHGVYWMLAVPFNLVGMVLVVALLMVPHLEHFKAFAVAVIVFVAAFIIHHNDAVVLPLWLQWKFSHPAILLVFMLAGLAYFLWRKRVSLMDLMDFYRLVVLLPVAMCLLIVLLPLVFHDGTMWEKGIAVSPFPFVLLQSILRAHRCRLDKQRLGPYNGPLRKFWER